MKVTALLLFVIVIAASAQWSSDPGVNLMISSGTEDEEAPMIALGTSGDSFVSWSTWTGSGWDMRLQRLDLLGNAMWGSDGILVRDGYSSGQICLYDLVTDQSGAAILTFSVWSGSGFVVYAYRISPDGDMLWGTDGILLSDTSSATSIATFAQAVPTSSGDVILSWSLILAPDTACTVMQRITPDGNPLWGDGIVLESDSTGVYCWEAVLCPTGTDDVILVYTLSNYEGYEKRIYAMRYDASGNPVWPNPAVISENENVLQQCIQPPPYPDGNGGFCITWEEYDTSGLIISLVQHVTCGGAIAMSSGGVPVSTMASRNHTEPYLSVAEDGENIFIFWREMNELETQDGLYGQRMDANGNRLWTDSGMTFIGLQDEEIGEISVQTAGDDAAVFYLEATAAGNDKACCMMVDSVGVYVWPSERIEISNVGCEREHFVATPLCWGQQWITVWDDDRGGYQSVFAQNTKLDGTLGTGGLGIGGHTFPDPGVYLGVSRPNPFSSASTVPFSLASSSFVTLGLYDTSGRLVRMVADGFYPAGNHTVDISTGDIPSGVYILRLDAMGETVSRACVLLR
ncbi:MAG: T9SS type A sorting domain-containing protein [Candidatus Aegiribacteria sp.]|nr:T9SS type A sorting domain-containing protein [Candidatus Aegiribacteria sp.]